jgi:capsular exopolysaccharide synthesis family protein
MIDNTRIDLTTFLAILRRRWWVVLLAGVLAAALATGVSLLQPDRYDSSADLLFQKDTLDQTLFGANVQDGQTAPERVAATNLELATLPVVVQGVERRLNWQGSLQKLRDRIEVQPAGQADIITVKAHARTPGEAVRIANAFADEVVEYRRQAAQAKVQRAIDTLRPSLTQNGAQPLPQDNGQPELTPQQQLQQLQKLKALQTGDVEVAQRAVTPLEKAAPKPLRNGIIGGILGLVLGLFAALALHRLDRRVRDDEQVAQLVGAPVLSRVPVSRNRSRGRQQHVFEALQFLRANLQLQDPRGETRVIAVTSPGAGDGKTAITAGLAQALALSGQSVVVVDCDLRKPMLHAQLQVDRGAGITDALVELAEPEELLQEASPGLRVLTAGRMTLDPFSIALALQRLPDLLEQLRGVADYVLVDTPPIAVAADASTVAAAVDGIILVVDRSRARRDTIAASREQLRHARAKLLGVVLNRSTEPLFGAEEYGDYGAREDVVAPAVPGLDPGSRRR